MYDLKRDYHSLQPWLQAPRAKGIPDLTAIRQCRLDTSISMRLIIENACCNLVSHTWRREMPWPLSHGIMHSPSFGKQGRFLLTNKNLGQKSEATTGKSLPLTHQVSSESYRCRRKTSSFGESNGQAHAEAELRQPATESCSP